MMWLGSDRSLLWQKHHKQPQSLAVCEELGLLAVVGDYSKRAAAAPTISLWTVEGSATSLCTWGRRPLLSGWLAALQAAEAVMVSTAFSAGGSQLLVQRQGSAPLVFILEVRTTSTVAMNASNLQSLLHRCSFD